MHTLQAYREQIPFYMVYTRANHQQERMFTNQNAQLYALSQCHLRRACVSFLGTLYAAPLRAVRAPGALWRLGSLIFLKQARQRIRLVTVDQE